MFDRVLKTDKVIKSSHRPINTFTYTDAYSEPHYASMMEFFCENSYWLLTVTFFIKSSIGNVWQSPKYVSANVFTFHSF